MQTESLFPLAYLFSDKYKTKYSSVKKRKTHVFHISALTFHYLCNYEGRIRFGIVKSGIRFPFVSVLTSRYLYNECNRQKQWQNESYYFFSYSVHYRS